MLVASLAPPRIAGIVTQNTVEIREHRRYHGRAHHRAQMPNTWRVVSLLSLVSCVGYLVRADVAVAQERMVPALGLTMTAMGAITAWGFQLAYTIFQVPAGMFGERVGARTALMLALLGCSVASFATGLMPESTGAAVSDAVAHPRAARRGAGRASSRWRRWP